MPKATIRDVDVTGRRVLVRVDFNVPLRDGKIVDDTRIRETIPTIKELVNRGARTILLTHLGRPDGEVEDAFRTTPLAQRLAELLGRPVPHLDDCVGPSVQAAVDRLQDGEVVMLENVRFHPGETKNDPTFARQLAALADLFVNDAFGAAHRAHASTVGVAHYLPAVAGLLMQREMVTLGRIVGEPRHPFVAIIGGSKISSKLGVLRALLDRADRLCIGGAMACTFLKAAGVEVGRSLVEDGQVGTARSLLDAAGGAGRKLNLPVDAVVALEAKAGVATATVRSVPLGQRMLDVGPETVARFLQACEGAATAFWNGPLGVYEVPPFDQGTATFARGLAAIKAETVVVVGDLVAALTGLGLLDRMSFVSSGGGATLEFLEGRALPGISALQGREPAAGRVPSAVPHINRS